MFHRFVLTSLLVAVVLFAGIGEAGERDRIRRHLKRQQIQVKKMVRDYVETTYRPVAQLRE